nr:peptidoglycan-binding protein [Bryobacterales bacterium]
MQTIRVGSSGAAVRRWQTFLLGQGFAAGHADGQFGQLTHQATIAFQQKHRLDADGVVGNRTYGQAMLLGFGLVRDDQPGMEGPNFPPPPAFAPLTANRDRQQLFGAYRF